MLRLVDEAKMSGIRSPVASAPAVMRTAVARVPLVTVVRTMPLTSVTDDVGFKLSVPVPTMVKVTGMPGSGSLRVLLRRNVKTDCSGLPDARTPMIAGSAPTNSTDPSGGVGEAVAVAATVKVATPDG